VVIGAYPGTFNPPTVAHLAIAEAAWEHCALDRLDLVVSRSPLGKEPAELVRLEDRLAVLDRIAATRPWLHVRTTGAQLLADVADGYDVLIVGSDKWAQLVDPVWYGGSETARDVALRRIRRVVVAPRPTQAGSPGGLSGPAATDCEFLDLAEAHLDISATAARGGRIDWMAAEAAEFDELTGAWTDAERYRRWIAAGTAET
jgi:nicotinic acid mononucleotide adenylyltransferase